MWATTLLLTSVYGHSCQEELLPLCASLTTNAQRQQAEASCLKVPTVAVSFSNTALTYTSCGYPLSVDGSAVSLDAYTVGLARVYPDGVNKATYKAVASNYDIDDPLHPTRDGNSAAAASLDPLTPLEGYVSQMPKSYQTINAPLLSWEADTSKYYTVLMVDAGKADSIHTANACEMDYLHWLVMNVKGSDLSSGSTIVGYFGPTNHELQPHTYIFSIYEQAEQFSATTILAATTVYQAATARTTFNKQLFARTFFSQTQLVAGSLMKPIAINRMQMIWDDYIPARLQSTGLDVQYGSGCNFMPYKVGAEAKVHKLDTVLPVSTAADSGMQSGLAVMFSNAEISYTSCSVQMVAPKSSVTLNALTPSSIYNSGMAKSFQTEQAPSLFWVASAQKYYTVLMVDVGEGPEYAADAYKATYLHWLVMNVPGTEVDSGQTIVDYFGPFNRDMAAHTYVFAIYEQAGFFKASTIVAAKTKYAAVDAQSKFDTLAFSTAYATHLKNGKPVALSWMQMSFDDYIPYRLATAGLTAKYGTGCSSESIGVVLKAVDLESNHHTSADGSATAEATGIASSQEGTGISTNWLFQSGGAVRTSPTTTGLTPVNNSVVFGADDGKLYSVNVASGTLMWTFAAGSPVQSSPTLNGQMLVFGSHDGTVFSVDASSGSKKWQYTLPALTGAGTKWVVGKEAGAQGRAVRSAVTGQTSGWLLNNARWTADTTAYRSSAEYISEVSKLLILDTATSWQAVSGDKEQWVTFDLGRDFILDGLQIRFTSVVQDDGTLPLACVVQTALTVAGPWTQAANFKPKVNINGAQVFMFNSDSSGSTSSTHTSRYWRLVFADTVGGRKSHPAKVHWVQFHGMSLSSSNAVYFGSDDGYCYCLFSVDGSLKWRTDTGGKVWGNVAVAPSP